MMHIIIHVLELANNWDLEEDFALQLLKGYRNKACQYSMIYMATHHWDAVSLVLTAKLKTSMQKNDISFQLILKT